MRLADPDVPALRAIGKLPIPFVSAEGGIDDLKSREILTKETAIACEKPFGAFQGMGANQKVTGYSVATSASLPAGTPLTRRPIRSCLGERRERNAQIPHSSLKRGFLGEGRSGFGPDHG